MKLIQILNAKPVLESLLGQPMPGKLAYALAKNIRLLDPELDAIDRARDAMLAEHWPLDPETKTYKVPDEDKEKWHEMYLEFLQGESDVQPYLMDPSWFEAVQITPKQMLTIDFLLQP